jgi:ubiquinone/menaquinone biosynthesis C-methylase UbiE
MNSREDIQRDYYQRTALLYDTMHIQAGDEHSFSFAWMSSLIEYYGVGSVLDVGAGTGRTIIWLKQKFPRLTVVGIEPVDALREQGYSKGLTRQELVSGNGNDLQWPSGGFDLVCAFGVLHHVPKPGLIIGEMLRVAKKGIFISDSNNFGQGGRLARAIKRSLNAARLWRAYDFVRTRGKMYQLSEGDGLYYSYSVFNNYRQVKAHCQSVHLLNSQDAGSNLYATAPHVALFGLKRDRA